MRRRVIGFWLLSFGLASVCLVAALYWAQSNSKMKSEAVGTAARAHKHGEEEAEEGERRPSDLFLEQRAYPGTVIPMDKYMQGRAEAQRMYARAKAGSGPVWTLAGPTNIPGRVSAIAVHPSQPNTIYAGAAAGGVFKTTDFGASWFPVFDAIGTYSIGAIAISPDNPNIVFVGTGEASVAIDDYEGTGIYKSIDAGATWSLSGLPNAGLIGKIVFDPLRPDTIYAAILGRTFGFRFGTNKSTERGVYRSQDGGSTWERVLYVDDTTGCIDVALHPSTGTLFAAMYYPYASPNNVIWKSSNNGDTWTMISGTGGLPASPDMSRIGLTVDPGSNTVYALHIDNTTSNLYGLYKSTDLGVNWVQTNDAEIAWTFGGFGWYFGQVRVAPGDPNTVYTLGQYLYKSIDGGNTWFNVTQSAHVDFHDMYILPSNKNIVYSSCDGGVNYSTDGASSWATFFNMPTTQFYAGTIDFNNPTHLYGGTQDNGTNRTMTGSTGDWELIFGGDGFYCLIDYTDPNIIYAESQNGNLYKSTDNAVNWSWAQNGINYSETHGWNTPVVMDPNTPTVLYYGTDRVYKTTDGANNWTSISPSLTTRYLTTIGAAKSDPKVIYAGSRTGTVYVTKNSGSSWTSISVGLPNCWITRLTVDPLDAGICLASVSGWVPFGDKTPHVFRTINYGASWTDISSNLPNAPVNDIILDPLDRSVLYVGTDVGVYQSQNAGGTWSLLGTGIPITCVHDLEMNSATRQIIAATHGRSIYKTTLSCCPGKTGNVNMTGIVDLVDLSALVSYLTGGGFVLPCEASANVNAVGIVDLVDLSALVSYLTGGGYVLPNCP